MPKTEINYYIQDFNLMYIKKSFTYQKNKTVKEVYEHSIFQLLPIAESEILKKRASGIPGFVLKLDTDTFYYTEIPNDIRFNTMESKKDLHLCQTCKNFMKCRKVLDGNVVENRARTNSKISAILFSSRIEKYSFIRVGFETFNLKDNKSFKVKDCKHYEYKNPFSTPKKLSSREKTTKLILLSQFLNPDIETPEELKNYMSRPKK